MSDAEVLRFAAAPAVRVFWDAMGMPADALRADPFLRENVLTWDSVGDAAPESVSEADCQRYLGALAQRLRESVTSVVLPAAQAWRAIQVGAG